MHAFIFLLWVDMNGRGENKYFAYYVQCVVYRHAPFVIFHTFLYSMSGVSAGNLASLALAILQVCHSSSRLFVCAGVLLLDMK